MHESGLLAKEQLFETEIEWLNHERWSHHSEWYCDGPDHPPQVFGSQGLFERHMRHSHMGSVTESQMPILAESRRRLSNVPFTSCPLCEYLPDPDPGTDQRAGAWDELENLYVQTDVEHTDSNQRGKGCHTNMPSIQLQKHISHHLQKLALLALLWRDDFQDVASSVSSTANRRSRSAGEDLREITLDFVDNSDMLREENFPEPTPSSSDERWEFLPEKPYVEPSLDPNLAPFIRGQGEPGKRKIYEQHMFEAINRWLLAPDTSTNHNAAREK
jgi:hypothetical protein